MPAAHAWGYTGYAAPDGLCWTTSAEAALGQRFKASSVYAKFDGPARVKATQEDVAAMIARRGYLYVNINDAMSDGTGADPVAIAAGSFDGTHLIAWAEQLLPFMASTATFGTPAGTPSRLLLTYAHEPTILWQQDYPPNWSPANYIAAFRHVREFLNAYFRDLAPNMALPRWVFAPVVANYDPSSLGGPNGADVWYPGDDAVDICGADIYVHSDTLGSKTLAYKFSNLCAFADAHGKKTGVFEIGVDGTAPGAPDAATQVTDLCNAMRARSDLVCAIWTVRPVAFGLCTVDACPGAQLASTPVASAWRAGSAGFGFGAS